MGPPENLTEHPENQAGRRRPSARPRARCCLLKGCEQRFHPRQSNQRYCSAECRKAARKWSRWKAQQRYRATKAGKAKRTDQSRRYRERVKSRKPAAPDADTEAAGNHFGTFFSIIVAIGPAATRGSHTSGEVPCSITARALAGAPCSASESGSAAGSRRGSKAGDIDPQRSPALHSA